MNKDDLLNLNDNKKNIKKPLIYGAIAFLIFIIGILGFAIYNNSTSKDDNVVLPPQINQETKKQEDTMFKEVPIEEDNSGENSNANIVKNLTNENNKKENQTNVDQTINKNNIIKENKNINKQKEAVVTNTPKTNQVPKIKKQKPTQTKTQIKKVKYYIQVAALMKYKQPNKKFLKLIKKEGYNYRFYRTSYVRNGKKIEVTKILIGPFTKNSVRHELKKVKEKITQNAFIFKVK